ncbi:uncharacterized protein LOC131858808 [Cryptomeria japonica]|uniref:uncharacterized protein LOC131858808 n=1 Tax=Cryptomeria japonica TaxID=3369 RepID=UPI0027DA13E1|nr:uncharacterized protein LOC131858808 [Cryptomeria japonica]
MKGKNDDLPLEVVPEKEVTEKENKVKKGVNNNNEKSVCACSNSKKESNKEEEYGNKEKVKKFESEDLKVGPIIQGKVDQFSYDDASTSSNNKENEEDFNEAQDCNILDNENKRLSVSPGKGKRKIEEGGRSKDEVTQSKKGKKATMEKIQEDMGKQKDTEVDSEDMGKDESKMETDESDGEESWKEEEDNQINKEEREMETEQEKDKHKTSRDQDKVGDGIILDKLKT